MKHAPFLLALSLAACSSEAPDALEPTPTASAPASPTATPAADTPAAVILALEGLGPLRIGQPVPAEGGWAERGAQISDECRIVTSPDRPGVYAIVEEGKVRRITLDEAGPVRLAEGIGVGASEAEVRKWFAGFREEPHAYVEAPAKYLTAPNAASGEAALRFEIGADRKVSAIHVGTMPTLGYIESCA